MPVADEPVEGLGSRPHMTGLHQSPGQVGPAECGTVGSCGSSHRLHLHLDALVRQALDHPLHPLPAKANGPLLVPSNHLGFRIHEIPEKVKLPLIQGTADLQGRHHLNMPLNPHAIEAADTGGSVMIRQGDDIQPGSFAQSEDLLRREGPVGSGGVDV